MRTRHPRSLSRLLAWSLPLLLAAAAPLAADLRPAGPEVPLTFLTDGATCPTTAALPDGSFLVVWSPAQFRGRALCNPEGRVVAQVLDRDGQPDGRPFVVGRSGGRCIDDLQIGFPADGGIPISWTAKQGELGDTRLVVRRLELEGRPSSRPVLDRPGLAVVHLRSGGLLAVSHPVPGDSARLALPVQRFNALGRPGPRFDIPLSNLGFSEDRFAAAEVAPGTVVVVWGGTQGAHFGRRFAADGTLLDRGFLIGDSASLFPRIAANGRGRFAVVWYNPAEGGGEVRGQLFGLAGAARGGPFPINTSPDGLQLVSSAEMTADGRLAVTWISGRRPADDLNAVGRLFAPNGRGLGRAVELASDPAGRQVCPRLVSGIDVDGAADGRWLATWHGPGPDGEELVAQLLVDE